MRPRVVQSVNSLFTGNELSKHAQLQVKPRLKVHYFYVKVSFCPLRVQ